MTTPRDRYPAVSIAVPRGRWVREKRDLSSFLARVLRILAPRASVDIFLIPTARMHELNRTFLKRDRPTTVLSFDATPGFPREGQRTSLGEVYLAPDVIAGRGMDLRSLALHGLLHLVGYTHDGKRDTIEMERAEEKLLKAVNVQRQMPGTPRTYSSGRLLF